jgi:hypothetical protein
VNFLYLPFLFQGLLMTVDEFYFHERRGLPRWERLGHPLDTLFTLITLSIPASLPLNDKSMTLYLVLATISSLLITKDEFIHSSYCSKSEHWIHSVLFILHPITFFSALILWMNTPNDLLLNVWPFIIGAFMLYQILRWNLIWAKLQR